MQFCGSALVSFKVNAYPDLGFWWTKILNHLKSEIPFFLFFLVIFDVLDPDPVDQKLQIQDPQYWDYVFAMFAMEQTKKKKTVLQKKEV